MALLCSMAAFPFYRPAIRKAEPAGALTSMLQAGCSPVSLPVPHPTCCLAVLVQLVPVQVQAVSHQLVVMLMGQSLMTPVIHAMTAPQVQQVAAACSYLLTGCEHDQLRCHGLLPCSCMQQKTTCTCSAIIAYGVMSHLLCQLQGALLKLVGCFFGTIH